MRTDRRRSARAAGTGNPNGSSDALTLALARLIRWAVVVSGTRNAVAISRVVRPPTARRVSGIADAGVSDGWQHMNMRTNVSSWPEVASGGAIDQEAAMSSRRRRASSLRNWSAMRREATRTSHPSGLSGTPSVGHCSAAAKRASCTASSALAKLR